MYLTKCLIASLLLCSIFFLIDAQRSRNQAKEKAKKKSNRGANCHLKEIESCFDKVERNTNDPHASTLITNSKGLDTICNQSLDVVKCIKSYMKKCGTPIQRELYDFATEHFSKSVEQFCKAGPTRTDFLKNSPCIQSKIISQVAYRQNCVNPMMATLDATKSKEDIDDRLDSSCCAYNRWEDCTYSLIAKHCGENGKQAMINFLKKAFGGFTDKLCPEQLFNPTFANCTKLYAPAGALARGKLSDNPVTKYIASYFGFLFN